MSETAAKRENPVKDAAMLVIITLVAALLLALVYEITKDAIAEQEAKKKTEAYAAVYPGLAGSIESKSLSEKAEAYIGANNTSVDEVLIAKDSAGQPTGLLITVTSGNGYGGDITLACGYTTEGVMTGISFLTLEETAGLGKKAQEGEFRNQFADKKTDSFALYKGNAEVISGTERTDAISNATITSEAVVNAVNTAIDFATGIMQEGLEAYVNE